MPLSTGVELTDEQEAIASNALSWLYTRKSGTLPEEIRNATAVVTYTGKASQVLEAKLFGARPGYVGTIHSLFYRPVGIDEQDQVVFELRDADKEDEGSEGVMLRKDASVDFCLPVANFKLYFGNGVFRNRRISFIIVDELSMIDKNMYRDLTKFGLPVLFCGDVEQLPPVNGLTDKRLLTPDYTLTEVHRQALDNGIIRVATNVRQGVGLPRYSEGKEVMRTDRLAVAPWVDKFVDKFYRKKDGTGIMLCGRNDKRHAMNRNIRKKLGYTSDYPEQGEMVICLKNNKDAGLFNGTMCEVMEGLTPHTPPAEPGKTQTVPLMDLTQLENDTIKVLRRLGVKAETGTMVVRPVGEKDEIRVTCLLHTFGNQMPARAMQAIQSEKHLQLFDFGYCLTVHKSQGSEWDTVFFYISRMGMQTDEEYRKWLYTGVTRAAKRLVLID